MSEPIRILIADDHPLFREGVAHSLGVQSDLSIIGQVGTGEEALQLAQELLPDVLLLDLAMPGWDGITTAGKIAIACPAVKIIVLTVSEDEDDLLAAFKAGARGYVVKGVSAGELVRVVRAVAAGEVYVSPTLAAGILVELSRGDASNPLEQLTDRERQVLKLVGEGLRNREIGERLELTEKTIKHYITNILSKLQVRSRVEAALLLTRKMRPDQD